MSSSSPNYNVKADCLEVVYTMKARSRSTLYIPDNGNNYEKLPFNCLPNVIVPGVQVSTYFAYNNFTLLLLLPTTYSSISHSFMCMVHNLT